MVSQREKWVAKLVEGTPTLYVQIAKWEGTTVDEREFPVIFFGTREQAGLFLNHK